MAKKSQKNSKHVVDLINSATLTSISQLARVDKFTFLAVLDTFKPEHLARSELLGKPPVTTTLAKGEAMD